MGEKSQFWPVMESQGEEQAPDGKNRKFCVEIITSMEKCKGNPSDAKTEATSAMQCCFFPDSAAVNSSFGLQSTFRVCAPSPCQAVSLSC